MQGLWEMGILTEGPVMFSGSTTKGEDIKVEMQKLVKDKIIPSRSSYVTQQVMTLSGLLGYSYSGV